MMPTITWCPKNTAAWIAFEARTEVIKDIDALGLMIKVEDKKVMQPFGDRSKVVIEPALTDQWFVDTKKIVQPAIDAVRNGTTKILPEGDKKVYFHWLENIEPWCISRQLWWGHQVPVWYGPDIPAGGYLESADDDLGVRNFCAANEADVVAQAQAHYGENVEIIFATSTVRGVASYSIPAALDNGGGQVTRVRLYRDPDVLDTWFSSGLWPSGTLGWPESTDELATLLHQRQRKPHVDHGL